MENQENFNYEIDYKPEWVHCWYIPPKIEPRFIKPFSVDAYDIIDKFKDNPPRTKWISKSYIENVVSWIKEHCEYGVGLHINQENNGYWINQSHMVFENRDEAVLFKLTFYGVAYIAALTRIM